MLQSQEETKKYTRKPMLGREEVWKAQSLKMLKNWEQSEEGKRRRQYEGENGQNQKEIN